MLGQLLERAELDADLDEAARRLEITSVELDSRRCGPGSLFVCTPGATTSGVHFVADAMARGAVCVVADVPVEGVLQVTVPRASLRGALARLSSAVVDDPKDSLALVGVTGTNGKTTVTWLLDGILSRSGYLAASIGTLTGSRTTPAPPELHRALRAVADRASAEGLDGVVALEVSSHALDQGRVDGLCFDVAVFTNLSHEHLDYHGSMERYFAAKSLLFDEDRSRRAVVCVDDEWGQRLATATRVPVVTVETTDATALDASIGSTSFELAGERISTRLTGRVNVTNALLALAAAEALGVERTVAARALSAVPPVPGRLEVVGDGGPAVVVDYAHSPDALERVLTDLRSLRPTGQLWCVFGCGGDRDREKRPQMGAIATRLADVTVVTSDNPRSEDPESIIDEVMAGVAPAASVHREADRRAAIHFAIRHASVADVVCIAGKGHEQVQEFATTVIDFDDRTVAAEALSERAA